MVVEVAVWHLGSVGARLLSLVGFGAISARPCGARGRSPGVGTLSNLP